MQLFEQHQLARLVKRVQKGDREAFGQIYERLYDQVYTYVLHQVGSPADAEDITAGVFLDALRKIDDFKWRGAGFSAWLFRIARNDVLDFFRQRGHWQEAPIAAEVTEQPAAGVEETAEAAWKEQELLQAISKLSEEQRQVVLLKLLINFSNNQIGEILSKTEGAVKALQHRALLNLRNILKENLKDEAD